jgi:hypothetical protein
MPQKDLTLWSQVVTTHVPFALTSKATFCIYGFHVILSVAGIISLNSINQLMIVMGKCEVFSEVQTEFLNII